MSINYSILEKTPRLLIEATLEPLQGKRFQPTGFADLGAARYTVPATDGNEAVEMLLVESAQSVANRMELACWDSAADDLIEQLRGLPYIIVKTPDGQPLTNSVLEAHRINSEYIMKDGNEPTPFQRTLAAEIGWAGDAPVQWRRFYDALLKYDPNSIVHGCFLEEIGGRLRVTRALSGFIEARDVSVAESGGVKNNIVQPELKGGEGNVPFHRTEFVAREIKAYFNLDLSLLRGYGFNPDTLKLLIALSLFKIRRFLSTGLRLRTACDLKLVGEAQVTYPNNGFEIPDEDTLLRECARLIQACAKAGTFPGNAKTEVKRKLERGAKPPKSAKKEQGNEEPEEET